MCSIISCVLVGNIARTVSIRFTGANKEAACQPCPPVENASKACRDPAQCTCTVLWAVKCLRHVATCSRGAACRSPASLTRHAGRISRPKSPLHSALSISLALHRPVYAKTHGLCSCPSSRSRCLAPSLPRNASSGSSRSAPTLICAQDAH